MSRVVRIVLVLATLPALHFLLQVGFGAGRWAPDLLTLALLLVAREMRMSSAALTGLVLGLLEDAFSILAFGANAAAMAILGVLGARSRDLFVGESVLFHLGYLFLGGWIRAILHWTFSGEGARTGFREVFLLEGPVDALWMAVAGLLVLVLVGGLRPEPGRS
ncbi:MAG: hypothetical protein EA352_08435 [Gemmatimonadales bacterium]|nr:MAG: hypothetical protein EA352_08435 [Gemmatimonadales bacterium]